jgi:uncharacterized protein (DUF2225 family)
MKPFFWICPNDGTYNHDADAPERVTCDVCGLTFTASEVEEDASTINAADLAQAVERVL